MKKQNNSTNFNFVQPVTKLVVGVSDTKCELAIITDWLLSSNSKQLPALYRIE